MLWHPVFGPVVEYVRVGRERRPPVVARHHEQLTRPGRVDFRRLARPFEVGRRDDAPPLTIEPVHEFAKRAGVSLDTLRLAPADPEDRDDVAVLRGVQAPRVASDDDATGPMDQIFDRLEIWHSRLDAI